MICRKNKSKFLIELALITIIFSVLYFPFSTNVYAADDTQTCAQKYPGKGKCIATDVICEYCPEESNEKCIDLSTTSLCPAAESDQQCCFNPSAIAQTVTTPTGLQLEVPIFKYKIATNIADYIKTIYKYTLYILVPIGIVIIIWAGIQWIVAGGNVAKIKEAKKYISGAIVGILIGLLSYVILSFIGITSLTNPSLEYIQPIAVDIPSSDSDIPNVNESQGSANANYPSVGGSCFPVASNSFAHISWNWGSPRSSGNRCHAGIDIYTKSPGQVVAIAKGTVVNVYHFYGCDKGWGGSGQVNAVLVYHPDLGVTVNYGEIDVEHTQAKKGQSVNAGQVLGVASHCGMNHFELYKGRVSANGHWYPPKGSTISQSNECRTKYLSTKPSNLMDPTDTIKSLQNKKCGG
ncbi:MAG: hypothetical protein NTX00_05025 [Candidatus Parcubacteria bacterium]|nr:hypothetical protein [Candidatus Parcubacteria bacterium]